jgi:hypothetical protein
MPAAQPSKEFHALCHEHHVEMRLSQVLSRSEDQGTQTMAYACPEPDCFVHYDSSHGYFMMSQNGNLSELDMVPRIKCPHDGTPMYLAEINPEKKGFRLWRCPQCDGRRTNEEGLINKAP